MRARRILIFGGTAEARELAGILVKQNCDVTTALAGATSAPLLPPGAVRVGGFGGAAGIAQFLTDKKFDAIADATHPFAAKISHHAAAAAMTTDTAYVRLDRPPWHRQPGDRWIAVPDANFAAESLPPSAFALLTIGRKDIAPFIARTDVFGVARMIEDPNMEIPKNWRLLLARPTFTVESELKLMEIENITHLVTKNSGGTATRSKLDAARLRRTPVVMIARPAKPEAQTAPTPQELATLLLA